MAVKVALDSCVVFSMLDAYQKLQDGGEKALVRYMNEMKTEAGRDKRRLYALIGKMETYGLDDREERLELGKYKTTLKQNKSFSRNLVSAILSSRGINPYGFSKDDLRISEKEKSSYKKFYTEQVMAIFETLLCRAGMLDKKYITRGVTDRSLIEETFVAVNVEAISKSAPKDLTKAIIAELVNVLTDEKHKDLQEKFIDLLLKSEGKVRNENFKFNKIPQNTKECKKKLTLYLKKVFMSAIRENEYFTRLNAFKEEMQFYYSARLLLEQQHGNIEFCILRENLDEVNNHRDDNPEEKHGRFFSGEKIDNLCSAMTLINFDPNNKSLQHLIKSLSDRYRSEENKIGKPMHKGDINSLNKYGDANSIAEASVAGIIFVTFNEKDFIFVKSDKTNQYIRDHIQAINRQDEFIGFVGNSVPFSPYELLEKLQSFELESPSKPRRTILKHRNKVFVLTTEKEKVFQYDFGKVLGVELKNEFNELPEVFTDITI